MQPLITLEDRDTGKGLLIPALATLYGGNLCFPPPQESRPYIVLNFVKAIDGPVTFNIPGHESGGEISNQNPHDAYVMGLLRAVFGNVMMGANAIRKNPSHLWTPGYISPVHQDFFEKLSRKLRGNARYRTFFVTASGEIRPETKPNLPPPPASPAVFDSEESEAWFLTTDKGRQEILSQFERDFPALNDRIISFSKMLDLREILQYLREELDIKYLLVEGGARFAGSLIKELLYDELFLTESDLIVGSSSKSPRLTFCWDSEFTPQNAPKHQLISIKKDSEDGNFIFTRRKRT